MAIRILITDDHRIFIDGMKALLKEFPEVEVVGEAKNGVEAMRLTLKMKPDIVLMDVQMPLKNGVEATAEIQKQLPSTKVIALTMANESIYIRKMLEAGAYGYVLKAIDKDELIAVIRKVYSGEKHFSEEITNRLVSSFNEKSKSAVSLLDSLTKREREILILIARGYTDKEIAEQVFLSPLTVVTHRKNLLTKLGLKNKVELTGFAFKNGLMS
ncbi:MAG: response regulator [Flavobacteriales bacterium]